MIPLAGGMIAANEAARICREDPTSCVPMPEWLFVSIMLIVVLTCLGTMSYVTWEFWRDRRKH